MVVVLICCLLFYFVIVGLVDLFGFVSGYLRFFTFVSFFVCFKMPMMVRSEPIMVFSST